jgi:hypothetical protein
MSSVGNALPHHVLQATELGSIVEEISAMVDSDSAADEENPFAVVGQGDHPLSPSAPSSQSDPTPARRNYRHPDSSRGPRPSRSLAATHQYFCVTSTRTRINAFTPESVASVKRKLMTAVAGKSRDRTTANGKKAKLDRVATESRVATIVRHCLDTKVGAKVGMVWFRNQSNSHQKVTLVRKCHRLGPEPTLHCVYLPSWQSRKPLTYTLFCFVLF